ncbi:uncharacterized protein LOC100846420 isoform X3 [Brachypodium distachyon]|nr:uncharacterized protein LOC100846420 isoform X3 [Brachypodium distachyon]|eukprot:XP_024318108.1 uncharacterized protein LOC100846420 isoform X3 [Brachypodium distachyon]
MFTNAQLQVERTGRGGTLREQYLQLNILELFLDCITEPNEWLVEFGVGGICNSCADPANASVITQCGGIPLVVQCLSSPVKNTVYEGREDREPTMIGAQETATGTSAPPLGASAVASDQMVVHVHPATTDTFDVSDVASDVGSRCRSDSLYGGGRRAGQGGLRHITETHYTAQSLLNNGRHI